MVRRIIRSPESKRDYWEIYSYIAQDNPSVAGELLRSFDKKLGDVLNLPEMGEFRPELGNGIRTLKSGRYIIFYRAVSDDIQLVRVIHGARDIPRIFSAMKKQ